MTRKQQRAAAPLFTPSVAFDEGLTPEEFAEMKAMYAACMGVLHSTTILSP